MPKPSAHPEILTVDDAQQRILEAFAPLPAIEAPLDAALGLVTAAPLVAREDLPPFDNSAMDGFAVRHTDTLDAQTQLRIIGQIAAGASPDTAVEPDTAIRIMTGAPIPHGADTVIRVEHVSETSFGTISIDQPARLHDNIRPAGEDVRADDVVLPAGRQLRPNEIALAAACGHATVPVHRQPRVGILVTGDEVVPTGADRAPGQIWNSNGPMIAAQVRQAGGMPVVLEVAGDSNADLRASLQQHRDLDLLITTGGVSVGDFDIVKDVLQRDGTVDLWHLRIKPGKPLAFGSIFGAPVIGLPGNPVAAAVAFWQFAYPAIRTMLGHRSVLLPTIEAMVHDRMENRGNRRQFVRVSVEPDADGFRAHVAGGQGSAMLASLAAANGLLVIPEDVDILEPGDTATVQMPDLTPPFS